MRRLVLLLALFMWVGQARASAVLERVNSEYFSIASALVTAYPFTFAVWVKATDETSDHVLLGVGKSAAADDFHGLDLNGSSGDYCRARTRAGGASAVQAIDGNYTANTWHLCVGVYTNATSRKAQLDSGDPTENTTSQTAVGMNQTILGKSPHSALSSFCDCKLAHVAIWDVALTDVELDQLAGGVNPQDIQAGNLVEYWSLATDANGLNGNNWTPNTTSGAITYDTGDNPAVNPPASGGGSTGVLRRRN